jgi:hypothetical protein
VNAPDPTRQVTLVGKAGASGDFSQAGSPFANHLDRTSQSEMHDVTVRRQANRSGEHAREVERATPRNVCERSDLDRLIEVGNDIVSEPLEHVFAQHAAFPASECGHVMANQTVNEAARNLVPEERTVRIVSRALQRQGASKIEKPLVVA